MASRAEETSTDLTRHGEDANGAQRQTLVEALLSLDPVDAETKENFSHYEAGFRSVASATTVPPRNPLMRRPGPPSNNKHPQRCPSTLRKLCDFPGCAKAARIQGMCTEHGGRRYCDEPTCPRVAQFGGKCTTHGGVKPCAFPGCTKAVQSRDMCKGHGGGTRCKVPGCTKCSISKGLCRGHGGGKRCATPGCTKWAQREGHCVRHHNAAAAGHVVSELV
ncbi:Aste57867_444 [Aphanomyces stellatus]|uniref:Aste57867_444 protein n=1 Tax=Aphanomyces stellatus TaxID=120398 RepID=A0A485K7T8_9STRA|nr:hypothetical protein As57867_000443 [Aphanomyces stellatus]VFT77669.1 Aste57867_444 [Aphanomyces stellatus]